MSGTFPDLLSLDAIYAALLELRDNLREIVHDLSRVDDLPSERRPQRLAELRSLLDMETLKLDVLGAVQKLQRRKRDLDRIHHQNEQLKREKTQ